MSEIISASSNSERSAFKVVLKALKFSIISYILSIILLAGLAIALVYTDMKESLAPSVVKGITLFGAFLSAYLTSRSASSKGWLRGAFAGVINILLLQLLGTAVASTPFVNATRVVMLVGGAVIGMIGGIFEVNSGNK